MLNKSLMIFLASTAYGLSYSSSHASECGLLVVNESEYSIDTAIYDNAMNIISDHVLIDEQEKQEILVSSCDDESAMLIYVPIQGLCYRLEAASTADLPSYSITQADFVSENLSKAWCFE